MPRIYLDVCCLNRPFDNQRQDRVRLESEAVLLILEHCDAGIWDWISSDIVNEEVENTPDDERRSRVRAMLNAARTTVALTDAVVSRGKQLKAMGFRTYDALHLASAEQASAGVFLTTDDRLIRTSLRHAHQLAVRVMNPLTWLLEEV